MAVIIVIVVVVKEAVSASTTAGCPTLWTPETTNVPEPTAFATLEAMTCCMVP